MKKTSFSEKFQSPMALIWGVNLEFDIEPLTSRMRIYTQECQRQTAEKEAKKRVMGVSELEAEELSYRQTLK